MGFRQQCGVAAEVQATPPSVARLPLALLRNNPVSCSSTRSAGCPLIAENAIPRSDQPATLSSTTVPRRTKVLGPPTIALAE